MEKQSVSTSLGLTQKELAMLLQVSRSHLSMFELGKGSLPLHAMQQLGELLMLSQSAKKKQKNKPDATPQTPQRQEHIQTLLKENHFLTLVTAKKLAAAERKSAAQSKLQLFSDYLEQRPANKSAVDATHLQFITRKSAIAQLEDAGTAVIKYQLKKELLEAEKKYLESLLREF